MLSPQEAQSVNIEVALATKALGASKRHSARVLCLLALTVHTLPRRVRVVVPHKCIRGTKPREGEAPAEPEWARYPVRGAVASLGGRLSLSHILGFALTSTTAKHSPLTGGEKATTYFC